MTHTSDRRSPRQVGQRGDFEFIDLFAGIGGTRRAFESQGGMCVFTCEWDRFALQTYRANFEVNHPVHGDIASLSGETVPDHDILLAGFPCQPFSLAGVVKKNSLGRKHGFEDEAQGKRFDDLVRIIRAKQPKAFVLENVRNLLSHDKGRTYERVRSELESDGTFQVTERVFDARPFVPQHRQRVIIVGIRSDIGRPFDFDAVFVPSTRPTLDTILHREDGEEFQESHYLDPDTGYVDDRYTISDHLWAYFQQYVETQRQKGNGFGYGLAQRDGYSRTLSARYYKDGAEILIPQDGKNPRRLTPRECARLMGFPDSFQIPVSDAQAYRQFGNSVVVPLFEQVAVALIDHLGLRFKQSEIHFATEASSLVDQDALELEAIGA